MKYKSLAIMSRKTASSQNERQRIRLQEILTQASKVAEWDVEKDDETDTTEMMSFNSSLSRGLHRGVTFDETCIQIEIMPLDEYTAREKKRCWYNEQDKERMANAKERAVARLERGKPPSQSSTYRGLECWTSKGGQELDENIARVVAAVMDEQDRQWASNCDDMDAFARVSKSVTAHCIPKALDTAAKDEQEAKAALIDIGKPFNLNLTGFSSQKIDKANQLSPSRVEGRRKSAHKMPKRKSKIEETEKKPSVNKGEQRIKKNTRSTKDSKTLERSIKDSTKPQKPADLLLQMHIASNRQRGSIKL